MSTSNTNKREFNRQYGNLVELHRRVFDTTRDYPRDICIIWYINGMAQISSHNNLKCFLTKAQIDNIITMSKHLIKSGYTSKDNKRDLALLIGEYEQINVNTLGI